MALTHAGITPMPPPSPADPPALPPKLEQRLSQAVPIVKEWFGTTLGENAT